MNKEDKHLSGAGLGDVWAKIKARFVALSSASQTIEGNLYIKNSSNYSQMGVWCDKQSGGAYIEFLNNSTSLGAIGITATGPKYKDVGGNEYTIWSEFNQGADSGMNADKLDGHHASYFAVKDTVNTALASLETAVNTLSNGFGTLQASLGTMAYQDTERYVQKDEFSDTSVTFAKGTTAGPTLNMLVAGLGNASAVIPSAGASRSGIVTTGTQTFAGAKTFSDALTASSTLGVTGAATLSSTLSVTGVATFGDNLKIANNKGIMFKENKASGALYLDALSLYSTNVLALGYETANSDYETQIHGAQIKFYTDIFHNLAATIDYSKDFIGEHNVRAKNNLVADANVTAGGNMTAGGNVVATGGVAAGGIADLTIY